MIEVIHVRLPGDRGKYSFVPYSKKLYNTAEAALRLEEDKLRQQGFVSMAWVSYEARYPDGRNVSIHDLCSLCMLVESSPDFHAISVDKDGQYWFQKDQVNAMLEQVRDGGPAARIKE